MLLALLLIALVVWLLFVVFGFVIHGLFWLAIIGIILFVITAVFGGIRRRSRRN